MFIKLRRLEVELKWGKSVLYYKYSVVYSVV